MSVIYEFFIKNNRSVTQKKKKSVYSSSFDIQYVSISLQFFRTVVDRVRSRTTHRHGVNWYTPNVHDDMRLRSIT